MRIAGAIIAGGRSSRMGGSEKAFCVIGGHTILERILASLAPQVEQILINANGELPRHAPPELSIVPDVIQGRFSPLVGIHASLAWVRAQGFDAVLTVPSDTPFLPGDLTERLESELHAAGSAVASSEGRVHFATGLWQVDLCEDLRHFLVDLGGKRAGDWVARQQSAIVEWPDQPFDPFFNVNTPEDLAEANRIAAEFGL
jgi:molybdopterin-guanine dinucleotide biosynthesis protein A